MNIKNIITIYGSYYPKNEAKRLKILRDCLREKEIENIEITREYPVSYFPFNLPSDQNLKNLERSRYCLRTSELNILIFTFEGEKSGVGHELEISLHKNIEFLLLVEVKEQRGRKIVAGSSLLQGRLKETSNSFIEFPEGDDVYLCDVVYSRIIDYFNY